MSIRFHFITRRIAGLLSLAGCVVSVAMLLVFPMQSAHQYANHFRTPQVRRSIERHTFIAHPDGDAAPAQRIANQAVFPALLVPLDAGNAVKPIANFELSSQVPISRLLLRLKLGSPRSGSQDPLL